MAPTSNQAPAAPQTLPVPPRHEDKHHPLRKDIQALRALAVTAVVVYHLWPTRLEAGLLGVDIFFVISGFLITTGIYRAAAGGKVALADFWARRARRLLPASLATIIATTVGILVWVPQRLWESFLESAIASILYAENLWLMHLAVDYGAAGVAASPFQHFWSLGVEEQFYIVWPTLFALAWVCGRSIRSSARIALTVAVLGTVTSFTFALRSVASATPQAFFDPRTRAWELGVGVILALVMGMGLRNATTSVVPRILAIAGWLLAIASFWLVDPSRSHPGLNTLMSVLGAALIIASGGAIPSIVQRVVALRPIQWTGDASYSIYLWHWPLIILAPFPLGELGPLERIGILIATVVLSAASLRWIEYPFRFGMPHLASRPRLTLLLVPLAMGFAAMMPLAALSISTSQLNRELEIGESIAASIQATPIPQISTSGGGELVRPACFGAPAAVWPDECVPVAATTLVPSPATALNDYGALASVPGCHIDDWYSSSYTPCTYVGGTGSAAQVLVIGDSHARQYLPLVGALADARNWTVTYATKGHCPWSTRLLDRPDSQAESACATWLESAHAASVSGTYDLIVTSQKRGTTWLGRNGESSNQAGVNGFVEAWSAAVAVGSKILVFEDNPVSVADPQACLESSADPFSQCATPRASMGFDPQVEAVQVLDSDVVALVTLTDAYCDADWCRPIVGNVNVYRNHDHFTGTWSVSLGYVVLDRVPQGFLP